MKKKMAMKNKFPPVGVKKEPNKETKCDANIQLYKWEIKGSGSVVKNMYCYGLKFNSQPDIERLRTACL